MSQVSLKFLKFVMVLLCLSLLSACGSKDEDEGNNVIPDCKVDEDCLAHEQCTSNEVCVARTSCTKQEHCEDGKACIDSQCVVAQCKIDEDCAFGYACDDGVCKELPRQCTAVGQSCDGERLARDGFACVDLGAGFKCQEACKGGPGGYKCATGSICIDRKYCEPSECSGPITGQATCDAMATAEPLKFPRGASCAQKRDPYGNKAYMCIPAGNIDLGGECSSSNACKAGLLCVPGIPVVDLLAGDVPVAFCAQPCDANTTCTNEDHACIGAKDREFSGGGICGDRCEPYQAGTVTCDDGKTCIPVSSEDGICDLEADDSKEIYSSCTKGSDSSECPSGTWCFGMSDDEYRCLPLCNPDLPKQEQQDATCPTPQKLSFVRVAHLAEDVGALDVKLGTVDLAEGLGFGLLANNDDFLQVATGTMNLTVRLAGEDDVIYTKSIKLTGNEALNFAIVADAESDEDVKIKVIDVDEPRDAPEAVDETTELRVVHAIADMHEESLDIVLVRAGEDVEEEANRQRLGTGVAYGAASAFAAIDSDKGSTNDDVIYDVYFAKASETDYLDKIEGLTVTTGQVATLYLIGTQAGPAMKLVEQVAADSVRVLGGHCIDLMANQGRPSKAGLGICFEKCTSIEHIGAGVCSGGEGINACDPVSPEQMFCQPSGQGEVGEACSGEGDCADGLLCDEDGAGSGTCRSYCERGNAGLNPSLACDGSEVCIPIRGFHNLGECRLGCEGGADYKDENCPVSQQSCFGEDGNEYCQGSGPDVLGDSCADPSTQSCEPGAVCAKRVPTFSGLLTEPFRKLKPGEEAYCRALCKPFLGPGEDSGCGEGFACSPILPGDVQSTSLGHCVESGPVLGSNADCGGNSTGKMCGDNAYCVEGLCLRFCEKESELGCLQGETCRGWTQTSSLFDVYNRCF